MPLDEYIERAKKSVQSLIETPIADWENRQWLLAAFLVLLLLWCCGCLCRGGHRRHRHYHRGVPGEYDYGGDRGMMYGGRPTIGASSGWFGNNSNMSDMGRNRGTSGGGSTCGCFRNLVLAACCFEFCCRDCQDVNQAVLGNEYSLKGDGAVV